MIKVRILDRCEFCDGEAYDRYRPCSMCHGSGNRAKWVSLREFADLLERAAAAGMICLKILKSIRAPGLIWLPILGLLVSSQFYQSPYEFLIPKPPKVYSTSWTPHITISSLEIIML